MYVQLLSHVRLFVTPWTVARQTPLSIGILQSRILEWVPCPSPGDLPNTGTEPRSPTLQADSLPSEPLRSPLTMQGNLHSTSTAFQTLCGNQFLLLTYVCSDLTFWFCVLQH